MTYRKGSDASGGTALPYRAHGPGCLTPVPHCRSSLEVRTAPSFAWVDMRARERRGHLRHTTCLLSTLNELVAACAAHFVPDCIASQLEHLEAPSALRAYRENNDYQSPYVFLKSSFLPSLHIPTGYPSMDQKKEITVKKTNRTIEKDAHVERLI